MKGSVCRVIHIKYAVGTVAMYMVISLLLI